MRLLLHACINNRTTDGRLRASHHPSPRQASWPAQLACSKTCQLGAAVADVPASSSASRAYRRRHRWLLRLPAPPGIAARRTADPVVLYEAAVCQVRDAGKETVPGWAEGDPRDLSEHVHLQDAHLVPESGAVVLLQSLVDPTLSVTDAHTTPVLAPPTVPLKRSLMLQTHCHGRTDNDAIVTSDCRLSDSHPTLCQDQLVHPELGFRRRTVWRLS